VSEGLTLSHELPFFLFFLFYQYTVLSSRAVDGHQMYSGFRRFGRRQGFDNWSTDLAHPPLIFTGDQKVRDFASFSTSLDVEQPAFENAARSEL